MRKKIKNLGIILDNSFLSQDSIVFVPNAQIPREFVDELEEDELSVTLFAQSNEMGSVHDKWPIASENTVAFPMSNFNHLQKIFFYIWVFKRTLKLQKPDFMYLFLPSTLGTVFLPSVFMKRIPFAVYLRCEIRRRGFVDKILFNVFIRRALRSAQFVLTAGPQNKALASKYNRNVELVVPMLNVGPADLKCKNTYKLNSPPRMLFISRLEQAKGIFEAIQAVLELKKQGTRVELHVVGAGKESIENELRNIAKESPSEIILHGKISNRHDLHQMYIDSDVMLFPSYYPEGFPRVLYEAMAFGLPIISADIAPLREFMTHKVNCIKVAAKDSPALVDAIALVLKDDELRAGIGRTGFGFAKKLLTKNASLSHAKQLIHRLRS